jgi:hypothetical protein
MRDLWLWVFSVWLMGCTTMPVMHTDKDLREQASLTDYRSALNPQLDQGTIYAKDIQVVCHTLLAKLGG